MWPFENSLKNQLRSQDLIKKYREWLRKWNFKGNRLNVLLVVGLALAVTMLSVYGIYNWKFSEKDLQTPKTQVVNQPVEKEVVNEAVVPQPQAEQKTEPAQAVNPDEMVKPVMGHVLTNVGMSYSEVFEDYRYNTGVALESKPGTEVRAAMAGTVALISTCENGMQQVSIHHGNGYESSYSGLDQVTVKAGQRLSGNEILGTLGDYSRVNGVAENHLYFKMFNNGEPVDPNIYWK